MLVTGGTGGHVFPAIAVAKELVARGCKVCVVVDERGYRFVDEEYLRSIDVQCKVLSSSNTYGGLRAKLKFIVSFVKSIPDIRNLFASFAPSAVVSFGSYASFAVASYAFIARIPLILHEQNTVLGNAHKPFASKAKCIGLGFPDTKPNNNNLHYVGNPIRPSISSYLNVEYVVPDKELCILITGGSQGANGLDINVARALSILPESIRTSLVVAHQTRESNVDYVKRVYGECGIKHEVAAFFDDMGSRLSSVHLVVCRAGAATIAENLYMARPAIYIPHPHSYSDHQRKNAEFVCFGGGGIMLEEDVVADSLGAIIAELMTHKSRLYAMSESAKKMAVSNSAAMFAEYILKYSMLSI